jgi:hypothetical protein
VSLTGLPLILLTGVLAAVAVAATVRGWRLSGRKRTPVRIAGLVAVEVLVVAGIGLVVNRHEGFYPSWQALGATETVVVPPAVTTGRLDGTLDADGVVTWSPPEAAAWRLAAEPLLVAPPDYAKHPDRTFPVVVALTTAAGARETRRVAASATGVLTVVLVPTAASTAASLGTLRGRLGQDARTADGLVVLADPAWTPLASAWPGRPPVMAGHTAAVFAAAARDLPAPLAAPQEVPS